MPRPRKIRVQDLRDQLNMPFHNGLTGTLAGTLGLDALKATAESIHAQATALLAADIAVKREVSA